MLINENIVFYRSTCVNINERRNFQMTLMECLLPDATLGEGKKEKIKERQKKRIYALFGGQRF